MNPNDAKNDADADNNRTMPQAKFDRGLYRICPSKLTKRELEDLYFTLLETNFELNKTLKEKDEKIRMLTTRVYKLYSAQKVHEADERKDCCISVRNALNQNKGSISDLRRANAKMAEKIRLLNIKLAAVSRQSGKVMPSNNINVLNNSKTGLRINNGATENGSLELAATQTEWSLDDNRQCDENKCRTLMEEFKQKIVNLEAELANTHNEYSMRISRLELEVKHRPNQVIQDANTDQTNVQIVQHEADLIHTSPHNFDAQDTTRQVAESEAQSFVGTILDTVTKSVEDKLDYIKNSVPPSFVRKDTTDIDNHDGANHNGHNINKLKDTFVSDRKADDTAVCDKLRNVAYEKAALRVNRVASEVSEKNYVRTAVPSADGKPKDIQAIPVSSTVPKKIIKESNNREDFADIKETKDASDAMVPKESVDTAGEHITLVSVPETIDVLEKNRQPFLDENIGASSSKAIMNKQPHAKYKSDIQENDVKDTTLLNISNDTEPIQVHKCESEHDLDTDAETFTKKLNKGGQYKNRVLTTKDDSKLDTDNETNNSVIIRHDDAHDQNWRANAKDSINRKKVSKDYQLEYVQDNGMSKKRDELNTNINERNDYIREEDKDRVDSNREDTFNDNRPKHIPNNNQIDNKKHKISFDASSPTEESQTTDQDHNDMPSSVRPKSKSNSEKIKDLQDYYWKENMHDIAIEQSISYQIKHQDGTQSGLNYEKTNVMPHTDETTEGSSKNDDYLDIRNNNILHEFDTYRDFKAPYQRPPSNYDNINTMIDVINNTAVPAANTLKTDEATKFKPVDPGDKNKGRIYADDTTSYLSHHESSAYASALQSLADVKERQEMSANINQEHRFTQNSLPPEDLIKSLTNINEEQMKTLSELERQKNKISQLKDDKVAKEKDRKTVEESLAVTNFGPVDASTSKNVPTDNKDLIQKSEPIDTKSNINGSRTPTSKHDQHNSLQIPGPIPVSTTQRCKYKTNGNKKICRERRRYSKEIIDGQKRASSTKKDVTSETLNNDEISKINDEEIVLKDTHYSQVGVKDLCKQFNEKKDEGSSVKTAEKETQVDSKCENIETKSKDDPPISTPRSTTTNNNQQDKICTKIKLTSDRVTYCPCVKQIVCEKRSKGVQANEMPKNVTSEEQGTVTEQFIQSTLVQEPKLNTYTNTYETSDANETHRKLLTPQNQSIASYTQTMLQPRSAPQSTYGIEQPSASTDKAIQEVRPVPTEGPTLEMVEGTLQVLTQELARCKELLLRQQSHEEHANFLSDHHSVDLSLLDDVRPGHALRPGQAKHTIVETSTPRCVFTLHIGTVVLSDEAVLSTHDKSLIIRWKFYDQSISMTKMSARRVMLFDFSTEYDIKITDEFLDYMRREEMKITICDVADQEHAFATCALPLRDALLHTNRRVDMSLALVKKVAGPRMIVARNANRSPDLLDASDEMGVIDLWCILRADPKIISLIHRAIARPQKKTVKKDPRTRQSVPISEGESSLYNADWIYQTRNKLQQPSQDNRDQHSARPKNWMNNQLPREIDDMDVSSIQRNNATYMSHLTLPKTIPIDAGIPYVRNERKREARRLSLPRRDGQSALPNLNDQSKAQNKTDNKSYEESLLLSNSEEESTRISPKLQYDPNKYPTISRQQSSEMSGRSESSQENPNEPRKNANITSEDPAQGIFINEVIANIKTPEDMKHAMHQKTRNSLLISRLTKAEDDIISQARSSLVSIDSEKPNCSKRRDSDVSYVPPLTLPDEPSEKSSINVRYDNISKLFGSKKQVSINAKNALKIEEPQRDQPEVSAEQNSDNPFGGEQLEITILWLALNEECEVMLNPQIQRVYVAYTFLGKSGADLETPFSLPKPKHHVDKCYFNFKKSFQLSAEDLPLLGHMVRCRAHSKTRQNFRDCIIFTLVSEPLEDPLGLEVCEDIGYAYLYLGDLLAYSAGSPSYTEVIPVKTRGDSSVCGVLAIRVDGLDILRRCFEMTASDHVPTIRDYLT